jgi:hypothetical protein
LPAFRVRRTGEIRVRQFVEDHDVRLRRERCFKIEFCETDPGDIDDARRYHGYSGRQILKQRTAFRFEPADDHAISGGHARAAFGEQAVRFSAPRRRGKENGQSFRRQPKSLQQPFGSDAARIAVHAAIRSRANE